MRIEEIAEPSVTRRDELIGSSNFVRQVYVLKLGDTKIGSLIVVDYGSDPDYPGRVVQTIEIWPEIYQKKGYAQMLYLAALEDGPINERPQFRSGTAERSVSLLLSRGLARREIVDGNPTLILA